MRNPRDFLKPLAIGAPAPLAEIPFRPSRMIHFLDFSNEKMVGQGRPTSPPRPTSCSATSRTPSRSTARRPRWRGPDRVVGARSSSARPRCGRASTRSSRRGCSTTSRSSSSEIGDKLDVIMVPKVEGPWDIHYVDRLLAQLEAKAGLERPILVHAILETALGVDEPRGDRHRQPAHAGHELRPGRPGRLAAHEDHARRRRPPRLPRDRGPRPRRPPTRRAPAPSRTRGTTRSRAWSTPAPRPGSCPSTAPTATSRTSQGCETQFRAAFLLGCVGAWSLHPVQIDIAKKVFSPDPDEVAFAKKVIEAIPDGRGVHMIDGKMQDDATWKQCKVMVDLAEMLARQGPGAGRGATGMAAAGAAPVDGSSSTRPARSSSAAGIPVTDYGFATTPAGGRARSPSGSAGPSVIKSQVLTGGRMKAGGVKFADTPERGRRARRATILSLEINGHMPRGVLVDPQGRGRAGVLRRRRLGRHRASSR